DYADRFDYHERLIGGLAWSTPRSADPYLAAALQHGPHRQGRALGRVAEQLDDLRQLREGQLVALLGHDRLPRLAGGERLVDLQGDVEAEHDLVGHLRHADRQLTDIGDDAVIIAAARVL